MAKAKRTLSPEQLRKMQEGKRRAAEHRANRAECDAMLSELEARLHQGRREAEQKVRLPKGRRKRHYNG